MPDRLPRELRVLHELAHAVAAGPYVLEELLERICTTVRTDFGFADVGLVGPGAERTSLLEAALAEGRAVVRGVEVAVPLLVQGSCLGFLLADRGPEPRELQPAEVDLLSALGLIAGVFIAKAKEYNELRRVDELKDEFVSIASHELRAPIAVVHGIAATLYQRGDEIDEGRLAALRQALYEQSCRVRELTEQLLDLSRLDAGRYRVDRRPFRPREAVDALLPPERRADVRVEIDPRYELVSDPTAFDRVVGNLLGNALKYGAPPVLVRGGGTDGVFHLSVEDHGPGVPRDFVPSLFDRFTRADGVQRSGAAGAGLGLAIASQFAQAVGGRLDYEPAWPHGSRFVLAVPTA